MYNSDLDDSQTKEVEIANNIEKAKNSVVAGEEVILNENSEEKMNENSDEKTKKLLDKKIVIGIICILAIVLCIVIYAVFIKGEKVEENSSSLSDETNLLVKDKETYEGLNYSMEVETIEQLGFFYNYSKNLEGNKIDVSYIKVSGLKDSTLESKINDKLKSEAESMYDKNNVQDSQVLYDHIYNYTDVYIFNNVLSTLYCEEKCDIDGNVTYTYKGININLRDFKEFNLNDVFINTANVEEIVSSQTELNYNENIIFSVSPKFIYLADENGKIDKVSLYNNKDKVAIYNRFNENKKLFNKTYNASPYAFTTKKFFEADIYGLEEDNLFIDTCNLLIDSEYTEEIIDAAQDLYKEAVNKARNLSYANPSKRYLVQIIPNVIKNSKDNYEIKVKINSYEISKQFFNEHIVNFVVESENKGNEEINVVDYFNDSVLSAEKYLNNMNTEEITKEVDKDGKEIIEDNTKNENSGIS